MGFCHTLSPGNVCSTKKKGGKNGKNVFAAFVGNSTIVCNDSHIPNQSGLLVPAEEQTGAVVDLMLVSNVCPC